MSLPLVHGWCPGAHRPMESGDGFILRIRPPVGSLLPPQISAIAQMAEAFGNGLISLSNRGNVQIRGLRLQHHQAALAELMRQGLLEDDPKLEVRRNIQVTPFDDSGLSDALAQELTQRLAELPNLPAKFGFAVDAGPQVMLADAPADIRLEQDHEGRLLLVADGHGFGAAISPETAIDHLIALAKAFAEKGICEGRGRMRTFVRNHGLPPEFHVLRQPERPRLRPGIYESDALAFCPFGEISAASFQSLAAFKAIRLTPWRMVLIQGGANLEPNQDLSLDADHPLLNLFACPGSPTCVQALGPTRDFARQVATRWPGQVVHVSGCAKGCAFPFASPRTFVATDTGWLSGTQCTAAQANEAYDDTL